jgi:hypothetical protein
MPAVVEPSAFSLMSLRCSPTGEADAEEDRCRRHGTGPLLTRWWALVPSTGPATANTATRRADP